VGGIAPQKDIPTMSTTSTTSTLARICHQDARSRLRRAVQKAMRYIEKHFEHVDAPHLAIEAFGRGNIRVVEDVELGAGRVITSVMCGPIGRRLTFTHGPADGFRPTQRQLFWGVVELVLSIQHPMGERYVPEFASDTNNIGRRRRELENAVVDALVEREARARAAMAVSQ
jgi:hypothetical protein